MHYFEDTIAEEEPLAESFEGDLEESEPPFKVLEISYGPIAVSYTSQDFELPARAGLARVVVEMIANEHLMPCKLFCDWLQGLFATSTDLDLAEFAVDLASLIRDYLQPLAVEVTVTHFLSDRHRPQAEYTAAYATERYYDELQKNKE